MVLLVTQNLIQSLGGPQTSFRNTYRPYSTWDARQLEQQYGFSFPNVSAIPSPGGKGGRMPMPGMPGKGAANARNARQRWSNASRQGMPPTGGEMPPEGGGMPPTDTPAGGGTQKQEHPSRYNSANNLTDAQEIFLQSKALQSKKQEMRLMQLYKIENQH